MAPMLGRRRLLTAVGILAFFVWVALAPAGEVSKAAQNKDAGASPAHALLRGAVPPPAAGEPLRIAHVSDTHIVTDGSIQNGADTAANLRVIIAAINALKPRPHLVAVTGDLSYESAEGLWVFKGLMAKLEVPYFLVPGNHDNALKGKACQVMFESLGFPMYYSFDYAGKHFVCVNAEEEQKNVTKGNISDQQLAWLRQDLKEHAGMETLLFLHQHPLTDDWNSPNTFAENAPILRAIRSFPSVKWVFNGHSHDNRFMELEGTFFITTTSAGYAFGANPKLPFAQHGMGFRVAELGAQGVESRLVALSSEVFKDPPPGEYWSAAKDPAGWVKAFGPDTASYKAPPEGPHVLVGLCQISCKDSALEENMKGVEEAAREAAKKGAKVICFPETVDLGWVNVAAHDLAQPIPGPVSDRVAALARELGVYIAIGLTEKVEGGIHDAAILLGPDGKILLKHRKINNFVELLTPPYLNGRKEDIQVAETPLGRIGILICADTFILEHLTILRDLKPDLVLVPYGWAAPPEEWPGHGESLKETVSKAAQVIAAPVIGPSCLGEITSGPWKGRTYEGESAAADGGGKILFFGLTGRRQVAVFPVQPGIPSPGEKKTQ